RLHHTRDHRRAHPEMRGYMPLQEEPDINRAKPVLRFDTDEINVPLGTSRLDCRDQLYFAPYVVFTHISLTLLPLPQKGPECGHQRRGAVIVVAALPLAPSSAARSVDWPQGVEVESGGDLVREGGAGVH
ncbi:MAG: hypothetical protein ACREQL_03850, partial [Candidatus Binatia bacterium]